MKLRWIEAQAISNGRRVNVRQGEPGGRLWVDDEGTMYSFSDLDFTVNFADRRARATNKALNSHIDKLWVTDGTIFLAGADKAKAEQFIGSLGALGYDTQALLQEYQQKGRITI
ncbi:MAG: hypothetical protein IJV24_07125 [Prevotella sp.]|nr:hypothetical protein [Prevotella sp.]